MSHVPPLAILVTHQITDFAQWKAAFDGHQPARKEASMLGHHINRDSGTEVCVYLPATDRAKVQAFLDSPDLRTTMQGAGVTQPPRIDWLKPIEDSHIATRPTAAILVTHDVADFDAWKRVYDGLDGLRRDHGVIGAAVNQALDNPNRVIVYHQAETLAELQAFVASPALKAGMAAGGVKSAPTIRFLHAEPGAAY